MSSSIKGSIQYALGTFNILCDALRRHNRNPSNAGRLARRFVLHQAVFNELCREIGDSADWLQYLRYDDGTYRFMDVPVIIDPRAERPRLLSFNNEIIFL